MLTVPELSSFQLAQLVHSNCSCYNTGVPQHAAFKSQGSSKVSLSCWPAGWSSQDTQRTAHNLLLWNRRWGDVKPPRHWQRSSVAPPQAQTVPKCWAHPGAQPHKWTGRCKIPPSTTPEGFSPMMLGRGELVLTMQSYNFSRKALHVLPKQNIQSNTEYLKK